MLADHRPEGAVRPPRLLTPIDAAFQRRNGMTTEEAKEAVRQYATHVWAYEIDDDGNVIAGGQDYWAAVSAARLAGHDGPVIRV